jgi:integrase
MEYQVIFRLYYCCGLRLAEACNLRVNDVDLNEGVLKIMQSKGEKQLFLTLISPWASKKKYGPKIWLIQK